MAGGRFHIGTKKELAAAVLKETDSTNTKKCTRVSVKCFTDFLSESGREDTDFLEYPLGELDTALKEFYFAARKTDGTHFKKSALQNIRYGLKRHIKEKRDIDILTDAAFVKSNKVFKAVTVDLKRKGLGKIDHHPPISVPDLRKLYSGGTPVFNIKTPYGLLRKVWFELTLYLCKMNRIKLRSMTKSSFSLATDNSGRRYIYQCTNNVEKNDSNYATHAVKEGRIYEIPGNPNCPVNSYVLYISKLNPNRDDLWQRPRDAFSPSDDFWYMDIAIGKNTLCTLMSEISRTGKLSKVYKNHSVRATSATLMENAGITGQYVTSASGQRPETSLRLKSCSNHVVVSTHLVEVDIADDTLSVPSEEEQSTLLAEAPPLERSSVAESMIPQYDATVKHKETEDEDDIFGKYVISELKKFTNPRDKALAKFRIQSLLFEMQYGEEAGQSRNNCETVKIENG